MDEEGRGGVCHPELRPPSQGAKRLVKRGCIRERFNRREVTVPQLAMHVGELQMTVVKKRDNDSQIYKKKKLSQENTLMRD